MLLCDEHILGGYNVAEESRLSSVPLRCPVVFSVYLSESSAWQTVCSLRGEGDYLRTGPGLQYIAYRTRWAVAAQWTHWCRLGLLCGPFDVAWENDCDLSRALFSLKRRRLTCCSPISIALMMVRLNDICFFEEHKGKY